MGEPPWLVKYPNYRRNPDGSWTIRIDLAAEQQGIIARWFAEVEGAVQQRERRQRTEDGKVSLFAMLDDILDEETQKLLDEREPREGTVAPPIIAPVVRERDGESAPDQQEIAGRPTLISVLTSGDELAWMMTTLYIVVEATGAVERLDGFPVPKHGDSDAAIRWYVPKFGGTLNDRVVVNGRRAFQTLEQTQDYLTEWTQKYRKHIGNVLKWQAAQLAQENQRERRMGP